MTTLPSRLIAAFSDADFRWLWLASTLTFVSIMAFGLAVGWFVLELTDSAFWVGSVAAFRGIGQVGFGVFAGVLLGRFEKRRVLIGLQLLNGGLLAVLTALIVSGQIQLWHLLVASVLQGITTSIRAPAFNTIVYQLVGAEKVLNANAAMGLGFNLALVVGSSATGALIDRFGAESGFGFGAVAAILAVAALLLTKGKYKSEAKSEPVLQAAWAGVRYAYQQAPLRKLLLLSLAIEMFGFSYNTMLPVVARDVLGVGAAGLGVLSASRGVGAALSNVVVAGLGDFKRKSQLLIGAVTGVGLFLMAFGFSIWYALSLILIFGLGMMLTAYDVTMKSVILLIVGDEWRERVQSIYTLTYGFGALSGFLIGWLATLIGASYALATSGGVILSYIGINWRSLLTSDQPLEPAVDPHT